MEYRMGYGFMMNNRNQPHLRNIPPNLTSMHYSIASYCTEANNTDPVEKSDVNDIFGSDLCINRLKMLTDPLQKNLADMLPSEIKMSSPNKTMYTNTGFNHSMNKTSLNNPENTDANMNYRSESHTGLSGIGSFISSVFSVISSAMPFQRRARSPETCNSVADVVAASSPVDIWPEAKIKAQNKNNQIAEQLHTNTRVINSNVDNKTEMSVDCHAAAANCEDKLATVRLILENKTNLPKPAKAKPRRPRKVFVAPGSYNQSDEDEVPAESVGSLTSDSHIACVSPINNVDANLCESYSPIMKTDIMPLEYMGIVTPISEVTKVEPDTNDASNVIPLNPGEDADTKSQIVASCEEKLNKLKALLPDKRKNTSKLAAVNSPTIDPIKENSHETRHKPHKPIAVPTGDSKKYITVPKVDSKKFKNPHSFSSDRNKQRNEIRKNIKEDMLIEKSHSESSVENSPKAELAANFTNSPVSYVDIVANPDCYFDEVSGRFRKTSTTESEDSFQIVFSDSPINSPKTRKISDCDSEDSFIVFEDVDNCYTSTDVFGDQSSADDDSDESSDYEESDGNRGLCQMAYGLSRTVSDLTDSSLYVDGPCCQNRPSLDSDDEVDGSVNICNEISLDKLNLDDCDTSNETKLHNSMLTPSKKLANKDLPPKKVRFSQEPPKVRVMRVWSYASRQARIGNWEQYALDRERFKRRIADVDMAISWVLKPHHRSMVKFQRFMPWWNAQRRQEIEEKKIRAAIEKVKEEERQLAEKERIEKEKEEAINPENKKQTGTEHEEVNNTDAPTAVVSDATTIVVSPTSSTNGNVEKKQIEKSKIVNKTASCASLAIGGRQPCNQDKNKNVIEKSNQLKAVCKNKCLDVIKPVSIGFKVDKNNVNAKPNGF